MSATVPASPRPTRRARRVGLGLVWLATALAGTAVAATAVLVARMDEVLASAVSQERAFPSPARPVNSPRLWSCSGTP